MDPFTPLERTALDAILDEMAEGRSAAEAQLLHAKILSRENTGGGFFVMIEGDAEAKRLDTRTAPLGQDVWLGVEGLEYGLGAILHCKDGRVSLLEGYAVGAEDTTLIDFSNVPFALVQEPGPFCANGS
jgi:hypothetical protein